MKHDDVGHEFTGADIFIDEQFLLDEDADIDKIYEDMKRKSQKINHMEEEEKRLSETMRKTTEVSSKKNKDAYEKMKSFIEGAPGEERLQFT